MTTYFDITDVVQYATSNTRVSGIQRVQLRIIQELIDSPDARNIAVVYYSARHKRHLVIDPRIVLGSKRDEFNPRRTLQSLGETEPSRLPEKYQMRRFLKSYEHSKLLRGLMKMKLYLQAMANPQSLLDMGFEDWRVRDDRIRLSPLRPLVLQPKDHLALLGSFWYIEPVVSLAREHHRQGGRVTALVHDVIPHVVPEHCTDHQTRTFWPQFEKLPEFVDRFLAVSEHTRRDFLRSMGSRVKPDAVTVVPLAHEFGMHPRVVSPAPEPQPDPSQRYVLCVGTIEGRKNGALLLAVWQRLLRRFGDETPTLVFCGKYGSKAGPFKSLLNSDPALQRKVRVVNSPSDDELAGLYSHALFTVFPSHYEGWGLPVGEAAWLGQYCLASTATSVPEVLGNLIDYADPQDPGMWFELISTLLKHPQLLQARTHAIRQARLRTWSETAHAMLAAITAPAPATAPLLQPQRASNPAVAWPAQQGFQT